LNDFQSYLAFQIMIDCLFMLSFAILSVILFIIGQFEIYLLMF